VNPDEEFDTVTRVRLSRKNELPKKSQKNAIVNYWATFFEDFCENFKIFHNLSVFGKNQQKIS
jgi:hypothetical protein